MPVLLAQSVADPVAARHSVLRSLLGARSRFRVASASASAQRDRAGIARAQRAAALRMRSRDPRVQMPPLGTAFPITKRLALIERWIDHDLPHNEEPQP